MFVLFRHTHWVNILMVWGLTELSKLSQTHKEVIILARLDISCVVMVNTPETPVPFTGHRRCKAALINPLHWILMKQLHVKWKGPYFIKNSKKIGIIQPHFLPKQAGTVEDKVDKCRLILKWSEHMSKIVALGLLDVHFWCRFVIKMVWIRYYLWSKGFAVPSGSEYFRIVYQCQQYVIHHMRFRTNCTK